MDNEIGKTKILDSPLKNSSILNYNKTIESKSLAVPLILTPLVDAFAILVIYLLVNSTATQHEVKIDDTISLPTASSTKNIESGVIVKIKNGHFVIQEKIVSATNLTNALRAIMAKQDPQKVPYLIVEADKESEFEKLSPIMLASSNVGFEKIKLAVVQGEVK
ncbi:MAG: biopolymer transporter ExbD [Bdellovibrionales bacterium]|nr:biopolymer transporter ExbD [Bdellovibrionales bacterium]